MSGVSVSSQCVYSSVQVGGIDVSDWFHAHVFDNIDFYDWRKFREDLPDIFGFDHFQRRKKININEIHIKCILFFRLMRDLKSC